MTAVMLSTVIGITSFFVMRVRIRNSGATAASGVASLASGLVTTFAMCAHVATVLLGLLERSEPLAYHTDQWSLLALGVVVLVPGLQCVSMAGAVARGELHAQKRTLAAAIVVSGITAPLSVSEPLAGLTCAFAVLNIAMLLGSRTNLAVSAQEVSLYY